MADLKIPGHRAGLALIALLGLVFWVAPAASAAVTAADTATGSRGQVTIVVLPPEITPDDLEGLDGAAIGLMNGGLGEVSAQQTWLDVSQGARAFDTTYDTPLERVYPGGRIGAGMGKGDPQGRDRREHRDPRTSGFGPGLRTASTRRPRSRPAPRRWPS